jgi:hypothetical protein
VDLVHRAVDRTWGWFTVNQGRQWRTACRCAVLPELWFTGPRLKGLGARGLRGELVLVVTEWREVVELASIKRWWWWLFGAHHGVDWSEEEGIWEWGSVRRCKARSGLFYRTRGGGRRAVPGSRVDGRRWFFNYFNTSVSRREGDQSDIGYGSGRGGNHRSYMEEAAGGQAVRFLEATAWREVTGGAPGGIKYAINGGFQFAR